MASYHRPTRRDLLRAGGAAALYAVTPAWLARGQAAPEPSGTAGSLFAHGVASGDPLSDGIVLWTRVSPAEPGKVEVLWEMALDADFQESVASGRTTTNEDRDFTVKVDVRKLTQGRDYYYRFMAGGETSPVGRTRLAPAPGDAVERVRLGVVSCSSYAHGWFHGYEKLAAQPDVDLVLHLGDYIYEYGTDEYGSARAYEPSHEIVALEDYRMRHAQYRRDPQLQLLTQQLPLVTVWDDHEIANDAWKKGAENHDPETEGRWRKRALAAKRAYFEWLPIRDNAARRVYRTVPYGNLLDLLMMDTRHAKRAQQIPGVLGPPVVDEPKNRQVLGRKQETWLRKGLMRSDARWKLLGQQVVMSQLRVPLGGQTVVNLDSWDGYPTARQRLFSLIQDEGAENVVVLTGDIHASGAAELHVDPFTDMSSPLAVELVTPSITSPFPLPGLDVAVLGANPHLKFAQTGKRGYMLVDVTAERVSAQWYLLDGVEDPDTASEQLEAMLEVDAGTNRLRTVPVASPSGAFV
jgi:alkaline phosphatase D